MTKAASNTWQTVGAVRRQLRDVLVPLQERAMASGSPGQADSSLLRLAERTAKVMSALYEIERREGQGDTAWMAAHVTSAMEQLRAVLTDAQSGFSDDPGMETIISTLASCLASIFAVASVFNPMTEASTERPAAPKRVPRASRVKKRLELVMEPSDPPPAVGSDSSPPMPPLVPVALPEVKSDEPAGSTERATAPTDGSSSVSRETSPPSTPASSGPSTPPSRRRSERVMLEAEIGFVSDTHFYTGITMDISTGGLFLATYQLLPVGTEVELSLALPGGYVIQARGKVRWIRDTAESDTVPGMGIAFEELTEEDQRQIARFCKLREPLYFDT